MDFVPPHNVIDLDLEATVVQVLVCRPFIPPPHRKPSKVRKEFPPITFWAIIGFLRKSNSMKVVS